MLPERRNESTHEPEPIKSSVWKRRRYVLFLRTIAENSAFPPMPVRSPKNSAGGGFKATPKKRLKMSASMKALRAMEPRGPSAMEKAVSLPHLPGSGDVAPSTIVEEVHAPLATQPPTDPMKLPPVDSTSRPEDAQVEV